MTQMKQITAIAAVTGLVVLGLAGWQILEPSPQNAADLTSRQDSQETSEQQSGQKSQQIQEQLKAEKESTEVPAASPEIAEVTGYTERVDCVQDGPGCGDVFLADEHGNKWKLKGPADLIGEAQKYPRVKIKGSLDRSTDPGSLNVVSVETH